jgi:hypothetical protein
MTKAFLLIMVRLRKRELAQMHRDIVHIMVRHLATHYSSSDEFVDVTAPKKKVGSDCSRFWIFSELCFCP